MFLWAASLVGLPGVQDREVGALYERLRPSLAILGDALRPTGAAALVDAQQGLFLAHLDAVQGETVQARIGGWRVSLHVVGDDARTRMCVLQLPQGSPVPDAPALGLAPTAPATGAKVCIVLADRGLPATFVGGQKIVVDRDRKLAMLASEIRFEGSPDLVGGALVVNFDGKLVGSMGATVAQPGRSSAISLKQLDAVRKSLSGSMMLPQGFRPGLLTVAYSPSLTLFRRSVGGLIGDGHRPEYAALGIQVGDAPGGGAMIRTVQSGSPAARSGIKPNDILLAIGDHPITRQFDFVQSMLAFRPGERTTLRIRHDGTELAVDVTFAKMQG